jgi:hypothetical protein
VTAPFCGGDRIKAAMLELRNNSNRFQQASKNTKPSYGWHHLYWMSSRGQVGGRAGRQSGSYCVASSRPIPATCFDHWQEEILRMSLDHTCMWLATAVGEPPGEPATATSV